MSVAENLAEIQERITLACERASRSADSVALIAVSKTWGVDHVQLAVDAGQRILGENKLQEGQEKIPVMSPDLEWHFIGGLQKNKVRKVFGLFHVIHSIDSLKLAKYANNVAADMGIKPRVLLQVNIGEEETKGGFLAQQLVEDFSHLLECDSLSIIGLMCIPPAVSEPEDARHWFVKVRELRDQLEQHSNTKLPHLSMGMSGDFEVAIEEGATYVRVGTSIFGSRQWILDFQQAVDALSSLEISSLVEDVVFISNQAKVDPFDLSFEIDQREDNLLLLRRQNQQACCEYFRGLE